MICRVSEQKINKDEYWINEWWCNLKYFALSEDYTSLDYDDE